MSYTQSFTTELDPGFGDPFQILLTTPIEKPSLTEKNKVPITIFISKTGPNTAFGCYIYSVRHPKTSQVYQTLLNNSNEKLLDITKKLSTVICKKYNVPTYVNVNGFFDIHDYMGVIKAVTEFIDKKFQEGEQQNKGTTE